VALKAAERIFASAIYYHTMHSDLKNSKPETLDIYLRSLKDLCNLSLARYKTSDKGMLFESVYVNHEITCERGEECFCKDYGRIMRQPLVSEY